MKTKEIICPINQLPAKHYSTNGRAEYYIEPKSGIIFQSELPTVAEMESFNQQEYKSGLYHAYFKMEHLKKRTAEIRLKEIQKYGKKSGNLLDIGCSVGFFLEVAQSMGYDVQGVELSSEAISLANDSVKSKIFQADANQHVKKFGARYDVVTAYDIIEHTQDPRAFLTDLYNALVPGGVAAIAAPDTDHYLRYIMGKNWSMLQPMQHNFLFSKRSIKALLIEVGFEDVVVQSAKKTLTIDYLFGQLAQTNPVLAKVCNLFAKILPSFIKNAPIDINIGEFFVIAKKPETMKK